MKKILSLLLVVLFVLSLAACGSSSSNLEKVTSQVVNDGALDDSSSTLVTYFSYGGNTSDVASFIANELKADITSIKAEKEYTDADLKDKDDARAKKEQNDDSARPAITNTTLDLSKYDTIIIGYPIWFGDAPKVIYTFLDTYDLTGKDIYLFATSDESEIIDSAEKISTYIGSKGTVVDSKTFKDDADEKTVVDWVKSTELEK